MPREARKLTAFGKTLTLTEWSEITGIARKTLDHRKHRSGWSDEKTISTKVIPPGDRNVKTLKTYFFRGHRDTIRGHCNRLGVPETTVGRRIRGGMDIEEALSTPVKRKCNKLLTSDWRLIVENRGKSVKWLVVRVNNRHGYHTMWRYRKQARIEHGDHIREKVRTKLVSYLDSRETPFTIRDVMNDLGFPESSIRKALRYIPILRLGRIKDPCGNGYLLRYMLEDCEASLYEFLQISDKATPNGWQLYCARYYDDYWLHGAGC